MIHQIAIISVEYGVLKAQDTFIELPWKTTFNVIAHDIFPKVQEWIVITGFNTLFHIGSTECGPMPSDFSGN